MDGASTHQSASHLPQTKKLMYLGLFCVYVTTFPELNLPPNNITKSCNCSFNKKNDGARKRWCLVSCFFFFSFKFYGILMGSEGRTSVASFFACFLLNYKKVFVVTKNILECSLRTFRLFC